jgi:hypothetical protein
VSDFGACSRKARLTLKIRRRIIPAAVSGCQHDSRIDIPGELPYMNDTGQG